MASRSLDWKTATLMRCLGYLANPEVGTRIEVELKFEARKKFEADYFKLTGKRINLPGDQRPYYVWSQGSNKYGREFRVHYSPTDNSPPELKEITTSGRSNLAKSRINRVNLVLKMFKYGFDFGEPNITSILEKTKQYREDFRTGYELIPSSTPIELYERVPKKTISIPPTYGTTTHVRTPREHSYTYILHYNDSTIWKIGYTDDLEQRIGDINKHLPWEYTDVKWNLEYFQEWENSNNAFKMEQLMLEKLANHRGEGERVCCTREMLETTWEGILKEFDSE